MGGSKSGNQTLLGPYRRVTKPPIQPTKNVNFAILCSCTCEHRMHDRYPDTTATSVHDNICAAGHMYRNNTTGINRGPAHLVELDEGVWSCCRLHLAVCVSSEQYKTKSNRVDQGAIAFLGTTANSAQQSRRHRHSRKNRISRAQTSLTLQVTVRQLDTHQRCQKLGVPHSVFFVFPSFPACVFSFEYVDDFSTFMTTGREMLDVWD